MKWVQPLLRSQAVSLDGHGEYRISEYFPLQQGLPMTKLRSFGLRDHVTT